ncbi:MAG: hypothetical protein R6X16_16940 [Anaerolineae bacterium]
MKLLSPALAFATLAVVLISVVLAACANRSPKENTLFNSNGLPPIDLQEYTQLETATFSLG